MEYWIEQCFLVFFKEIQGQISYAELKRLINIYINIDIFSISLISQVNFQNFFAPTGPEETALTYCKRNAVFEKKGEDFLANSIHFVKEGI